MGGQCSRTSSSKPNHKHSNVTVNPYCKPNSNTVESKLSPQQEKQKQQQQQQQLPQSFPLQKAQSDDFYDGIPRFELDRGGLSHKSRSARSTQAAVAKVCC